MIGGYDPATDSYPMRAFDNTGSHSTMRATVAEDGTNWTRWMDMAFTRSTVGG